MIEWLAHLDPQVLLVGFAVAGTAIALPLALAGARRLWHLRIPSGTVFLLAGAMVLALAIAGGLLAASLHGYKRLTHEQDAARVSLRKLGERHFIASVRGGGQTRHFELRGDEWQIDARVLKWRGLGTLAGLDTVYRLDRLSGRYADIASERALPRTVHPLAEQPAVDFWTLARRYHRYLPLADALYGSAAYVPMAEGADYVVTVSAFGLVVRPGNAAAHRAVAAWR